MLVAGTRSSSTNPADVPSPATLPAAVRDHLGHQLQAAYGALISAPPQCLLDLLAQLDDVLSTPDSENATTFRQGLIEALPGLRAFAISLAQNEARADDLVQETLLKAWAKQALFKPGSNLQAWLCTILRNNFYSEIRKYKREVEDADGAMAAQVVAPAAQEHSSDLRTLWGEMANLSALHREALMLVGAQGLSYEAAAEVMGCEVGTAKSRVSRARALLAEKLAMPSRRISA